MRLSGDIVEAAKAEAAEAGIEAAGLLAVIEVESAGKPYELADKDLSDGRFPIALFERHLFHRHLKSRPALLKRAVAAGLAIPKWSPKSQYVDQKTSAGKIALIERAMLIDREAALDSTSLGLMQVCGFNAEACGYADAEAMFEALTKGLVSEQLQAGIAFMRSNGLLRHLAARDWKVFAKGYNGASYAKNKYDAKLAAAYSRWSTALKASPAELDPKVDPSTLRMGDKGPLVRALQEALTAMGVVTKVDGDYGPAVRRNVAAAQVELGLTGTGIADPATVAAIEAAEPISKGAREVASTADLREAGNPQVRNGDAIRVAGTAGLGVVGVGQAAVSLLTDNVDAAKGAIATAREARDDLAGVVGDGLVDRAIQFLVDYWQVVVMLGVCVGVVVLGTHVVRCAVIAHRTGRTV